MSYKDVLLWILAAMGFMYAVTKLLELLGRFFDAAGMLLTRVKIRIYYPIAIRINKRKHRDYVEEYFNNLLFRSPIE